MSVIELRSVSKWFGSVVAVSDVSFSIDRGVTALLGPNGAGKSTVLRMLCGLTRPSDGSVRVLGGDPATDPALARRIGERVRLFFNGLKQLFEQGGFSGAVREELNRAENQGLKRFLISVWQVVYRIQQIWEGFKDGFTRTIEDSVASSSTSS